MPIHWAEASQRLALLDNLPAQVVAQLAEVLNWPLTPGTVGQVDERLAPAVDALRAAYEAANAAAELSSADRGMLVTVFADSMKLADDAAPALTPGLAGESLGGVGMQLAPALRTIKERLERVPSIKGIPSDTLAYLAGIARIVKGARTECVSYGDMALYVARSNAKAIANDGWKSLTRSKPQNKGLLAWADAVAPVPESVPAPQQQPARGTVGWLVFQLSSAEWYAERAAAQRAKITGSQERRGHDSHFLQTAMQHGRDAERVRQSIAAAEGVGRLQTLCDAQGGKWGSAWLRQQRGRLCESLDIPRSQVDALTVAEFGEQLRRVDGAVPAEAPKGAGNTDPVGVTEANGDTAAELAKLAAEVAAIKRKTKPTGKEAQREAKKKFIRPRIAKGETWAAIADAWRSKPPHDWNAENLPDAMRLFWNRYGDQ